MVCGPPPSLLPLLVFVQHLHALVGGASRFGTKEDGLLLPLSSDNARWAHAEGLGVARHQASRGREESDVIGVDEDQQVALILRPQAVQVVPQKHDLGAQASPRQTQAQHLAV